MATSYYYTTKLQLKINGIYVDAGAPSWTTSKGVEGQYIIRGYKDVDGTLTNLRWGADYEAFSVSVGGTSKITWVTDDGGMRTHAEPDGYTFVSRFKAKDVPATWTPSFTATRRATPSSPTTISVPIKPGTKNQTITYSAVAVTVPSLKGAMVDASGIPTPLSNAINGNEKSSQVKWDAKIEQWVVVISNKVTNFGKDTWQTQVNYYGPNGSLISAGTPKVDPKAHGKNYVAAQKVLLSATKDTYTTTETLETTGNVPVTEDKYQFNPPNHYSTRPPSMSDILSNVKSTGGGIVKADVKGISKGHYELGRMLQDEAIVPKINTKNGKTTKTTPIYGFRFTYNPSSLRYSTTANAPIDWTLYSSDTANILGGPTIVSFELYLNRIADVYDLERRYSDSNYPKALDDKDKANIKLRGTEYDLEYLYRIVNGIPMETSLTQSRLATSDFGYITGLPFWLFLSDGLHYYGGLAGLDVNHVMFSRDMVPIFSVVSVTFNRYPVFDAAGYVGKKQGEAFAAQKATK